MENYNSDEKEQAKRKYHEKWWEFKTEEGLLDAVLYQTNEKVWLIPKRIYKEGLEILLNREIFYEEVENRKSLIDEVLKAYAETINTAESDDRKAIKNKLALLRQRNYTSQRGPERHKRFNEGGYAWSYY